MPFACRVKVPHEGRPGGRVTTKDPQGGDADEPLRLSPLDAALRRARANSCWNRRVEGGPRPPPELLYARRRSPSAIATASAAGIVATTATDAQSTRRASCHARTMSPPWEKS